MRVSHREEWASGRRHHGTVWGVRGACGVCNEVAQLHTSPAHPSPPIHKSPRCPCPPAPCLANTLACYPLPSTSSIRGGALPLLLQPRPSPHHGGHRTMGNLIATVRMAFWRATLASSTNEHNKRWRLAGTTVLAMMSHQPLGRPQPQGSVSGASVNTT